MNKIIIIGNTTHSPQSNTTSNGVQYTTFTVAVNRRDKDAQFFRVTAWRGLADTCSKFIEKGKKVAVIGELELRQYEGRDGTMKASLEITASDVEFLSPKAQTEPPTETPAGFTEVDDLPFK